MAVDMTDLLRTLESEADAVSEFVRLLKLEQVALENGDINDLVGFTQDKTTVSNELTALANQRNTALAGLGLASDRTGIEDWLKGRPSDIRGRNAWARIVELATEARNLNNLNGTLIQIRMQHNAQALAALQGASRTLNLYGPDGQTEPLLSPRINDAA